MHRGLAPADVHAERERTVQCVVARRDAIEHVFDDAGFLRRFGKHVGHVGQPVSSRRAASTLIAASSVSCPTDSRCSCATSSSTRRKWCATIGGDRGQHRAERFDELFGLLVVGQHRTRGTVRARSGRRVRRRFPRSRASSRGVRARARAGRGAGGLVRAAAVLAARRRCRRSCTGARRRAGARSASARARPLRGVRRVRRNVRRVRRA